MLRYGYYEDFEGDFDSNLQEMVSEGFNINQIVYFIQTNTDSFFLGEGYFAEVWGHPDEPDRVIKIAPGGDKCFEEFAIDMPTNRHFPEVYDIYNVGPGLIVVTERLEPLSAANFETLDLQSQLAFVYLVIASDHYGNFADVMDNYPVQEVRDWLLAESVQRGIGGPEGVDLEEGRPHPEDVYALLASGCTTEICLAVDALFQYLEDTCRIDMHMENAMVRDDGTLVFTDPYAYR